MMSADSLVQIPPRSGKAVRVARGQRIKIVNTHGTQVVDTWAFNALDLGEFMSMEHLRASLNGIFPKPGAALVTNRRRPILHFVEDTSPGIHDTLIAACDIYRYQGLGCAGYHENCTDNLFAGMRQLGLRPDECPSPLNLWMNIPVSADTGAIDWLPPVSKPGDYVVFEATMDCIMAFSACPQDMLPINGLDGKPTEAHFQLMN